MASFRRDMPGRRFPPRPGTPERAQEAASEREREEPQERAYGPGPGFSSQRESGFRRTFEPTPLRERPSKRHWTDIVVPESEKEDPYHEYTKVFTIFEKGRRAPGAAPMPPPREGPAESSRSERPGRAPNQPPMVDPSNWFDLGRIWAAIQTVRSDPRFTPGKPVAVVKIGNAARSETERAQDLIRFFRIPPEEVRRFSTSVLWSDLLNPFLDELAYALNTVKPREFPGKVRFQAGNDGSYWLGYLE